LACKYFESLRLNGGKRSARWLQFCRESLDRTPQTAGRYMRFYELLKEFPKLRLVNNMNYWNVSKNAWKIRKYLLSDPQGIELAKTFK
jgi:hypothetical protein